MTQSSDGGGAVSAQAYAAIQNLYARYNWCSDQGDANGYAACFTEDGELSLPGVGLHVRGRENLREFKRQDKARRGDRIRRHWNSGLWLEAVDGETMRGDAISTAMTERRGEAPVLNDIGAYDDTIVRRDGEWRFAKRVIAMDHSAFRPPAES